MGARRHERSVAAAVVDADTPHHHPLVVRVVGILQIGAGDGLFLPQVRLGLARLQKVGLVVVVMVEAQPGREAMGRRQLRLEKQRGVAVLLVDVVGTMAIDRLLVMERTGQDEGQVRVLLLVEDIGVLGEGLVAFRLDAHPVAFARRHRGGRRSVHVGGLSALALLFHGLDRSLEDVMVAHPGPTVLQVILFHLRHVHESVAVLVVSRRVVLVMGQYSGAEALAQGDVAVDIGLDLKLRIAEKVDVKRGRCLRFLELDIDLPRDGLVAVLDRRGAFRHLNALHPRAGHITQGKGGGGTAVVRDVFGQHLHIGAREAEELDLLRPRGGIGVAHVDRRVGGEALAQVAAGGAGQFAA